MRRRDVLAAFACGFAAAPSRALMAGDPPDAPQKRVDPNVPASPWSGVGSVTTANGVYSGVLVHPRYALTAGHVAPADAAGLHFNLNVQGDLSNPLAVRRVTHHPKFRGFSPTEPAFDLALLELADIVPPGVAVHPVVTRRPEAGMQMQIVGYGASGYGAVGVTVPAHATVRRTGSATIERILADPQDASRALLYFFTFARSSLARVPPSGPLAPTGLASGDSGSPCFVRTKDRLGLLGINTFVRSATGGIPFGFGTIGGGQVLSAHLDWLRSVIKPSS